MTSIARDIKHSLINYVKYKDMKELTNKTLDLIKSGNFTSFVAISYEYNLSEEFIRQYQDKLDWGWVCLKQKLSEEFIIEFKDKIRCYFLVENKHIHTYSKSTQIFILKDMLANPYDLDYYYQFMTEYMKEQYNRLKIML
jgi:hypothetical protein